MVPRQVPRVGQEMGKKVFASRYCSSQVNTKQELRNWREEAACVGWKGKDHVVYGGGRGGGPASPRSAGFHPAWLGDLSPLPLAELENKDPLCPAYLLLNHMSERANEIPF